MTLLLTLALTSSSLGSALVAVIIAFAILAGIYWATGYFGFPQAQRIVGLLCLILFVLYALSRFGFLAGLNVQL